MRRRSRMKSFAETETVCSLGKHPIKGRVATGYHWEYLWDIFQQRRSRVVQSWDLLSHKSNQAFQRSTQPSSTEEKNIQTLILRRETPQRFTLTLVQNWLCESSSTMQWRGATAKGGILWFPLKTQFLLLLPDYLMFPPARWSISLIWPNQYFFVSSEGALYVMMT